MTENKIQTTLAAFDSALDQLKPVIEKYCPEFPFLPRTHTDGQRQIISKRKYINVCVGPAAAKPLAKTGLWLIYNGFPNRPANINQRRDMNCRPNTSAKPA